jgi:hypothetical protein
MLRVEVELKLMLDVEERTHDAAQAAFVQYLGEVGPQHTTLHRLRLYSISVRSAPTMLQRVCP